MELGEAILAIGAGDRAPGFELFSEYTAPLQVDATQTTVVGRPWRGGSRWRMCHKITSPCH